MSKNIKKIGYGVYRYSRLLTHNVCEVDWVNSTVREEYDDWDLNGEMEWVVNKEYKFAWMYSSWMVNRDGQWKYAAAYIKQLLWDTYPIWVKEQEEKKVEEILLGEQI